ncbi:MAG TPA: class I SAM-dependent methyltransferase [Nitrososphaera sp.]|nr:class I SAM-dependent methyltransferase [Nitrososphaera sp.]
MLDIGCGTGNFLRSLGKARSIGIELEMTALLIARKSNPNAEFILSSSLNLPFRNGVFDQISAWEVIEHVPRGKESMMVSEIGRVLRPDALFLMSTPSNHYLSVALDPAYFLRGHRHYDIDSLHALLAANGFYMQRKALKGGIYSLVATNLLYIFKHILHKRPRGRVYGYFLSRSGREYSDSYKGFANWFIAAQKVAS